MGQRDRDTHRYTHTTNTNTGLRVEAGVDRIIVDYLQRSHSQGETAFHSETTYLPRPQLCSDRSASHPANPSPLAAWCLPGCLSRHLSADKMSHVAIRRTCSANPGVFRLHTLYDFMTVSVRSVIKCITVCVCV